MDAALRVYLAKVLSLYRSAPKIWDLLLTTEPIISPYLTGYEILFPPTLSELIFSKYELGVENLSEILLKLFWLK